MKKILFFSMMALCAMFIFTACGGDDKNDDKGGTEYNGNGEQEIGSATFSENGNTMVLTFYQKTGNMSIKHVLTCTFDNNDKLTKATEAMTFPSAELAKLTYDAAVAEEGTAKWSISGNTVTKDITEDYSDMTRDQIRQALKILAETYK